MERVTKVLVAKWKLKYIRELEENEEARQGCENLLLICWKCFKMHCLRTVDRGNI